MAAIKAAACALKATALHSRKLLFPVSTVCIKHRLNVFALDFFDSAAGIENIAAACRAIMA